MIRITGGEFRGRSIATPANDRTRPTQAKLRQALFNSLQAAIPGSRILDLFAGSGALGFEGLSRGAVDATFVESAKPAVTLIEKSAKILGVEDRIRVLGDSVDRVLPRLLAAGPFDVVFADPPYAGGWESRLLSELDWEKLLAPAGYFCLEWGTQKSRVDQLPESVPFLVKTREKIYGDSVLTTYQRTDRGGVLT